MTMRIIQKIFIWLFVIMAFVVLGFYVFVKLNGKQFVEERLRETFQREVQTAEVRFIFPLGLRIDRLDIKGLFRAREIRVQMALPVVLGRQVFVAGMKIEEPFLVLQRTKNGQLIVGEVETDESAKGPAAHVPADTKKNEPQKFPVAAAEAFSLVVDDIEVHNGQFQFIDHSKEKQLSLTLDQIQLKAQSLAYPLRSLNTRFNLTALMTSEDIPFSGSQVRTHGWINWWERNLDGTLEVLEPNGMVGLSADLNAQHNDLLIKGKANMSHLGKKSKKGEKEKPFSIEDLIVEALKTSNLEINADFAVKTKLDNFELSSISFTGSVGSPDSGALQGNLKNIGQKFEEFGKKLIEKESGENVNAMVPQEGVVK